MHQYPESPDFFFILQGNLKIKRLVIGRLKKTNIVQLIMNIEFISSHIINYLVMYLIKRQKETVKELMSQMMSLIRTKLVLAILRQFSSCFGLFDIAGQTQYRYIVVKYKNQFALTTKQARRA